MPKTFEDTRMHDTGNPNCAWTRSFSTQHCIINAIGDRSYSSVEAHNHHNAL